MLDRDWREQVDPFFREMLPEFERNLLKDTARLEELLEAGQWEELRRLAHNYKGTAGYFDLTQLSEVARALESKSKSGDHAGAASEVARWQALVDRLEIGRR